MGWVTSPRALVVKMLWSPVKVVGWVTSPRALVGQAVIETDLMMVWWCPIVRWNHCLMSWGGWPLEGLDEFWLMCSMRSHIHALNMARVWMVEERFGSTILRTSGTWKSHPEFVFCIINERLFLFVSLWEFWWIICGLYDCTFMSIFCYYYVGYVCVLWQ